MQLGQRLSWAGLLFAPGLALGQGFSSGSNGSDGALNVAGGQGVVVFDPAALSIDGDGDRVFHFTTVQVGAGTTLRFPASTLGQGRPIVWLASGQVTIDGILDLNGATGGSGVTAQLPADAGAGGFAGGTGGTSLVPPKAGSGPGGGGAEAAKSGGGAGHLVAGNTGSAALAAGGAAYGNVFVLPALGGSGGGGGAFSSPTAGGGGGGGGGAIVIASSTGIERRFCSRACTRRLVTTSGESRFDCTLNLTARAAAWARRVSTKGSVGPCRAVRPSR